MRWAVTVADPASGAEQDIGVTADTEAEAYRKATDKGFFVLRATEYKEQPAPVEVSPAPELPPPPYAEIVNGVEAVRNLSDLMKILGAAAAGIGIALGGWLIARGQAGPGIMLVVAGVFYGVILFIVAVLIRLLAGISVAIRDIALSEKK